MSKLCPESLEIQNSLLGNPSVRHPEATCDRLGHVPRTFATLAVPVRLFLRAVRSSAVAFTSCLFP